MLSFAQACRCPRVSSSRPRDGTRRGNVGILGVCRGDNRPAPIVTVSSSDPNAAEAGFDTGRYTFTRAAATSSALIVTFTTGVTATGGVDYTPSNGSPQNITIRPVRRASPKCLPD